MKAAPKIETKNAQSINAANKINVNTSIPLIKNAQSINAPTHIHLPFIPGGIVGRSPKYLEWKLLEES